MVECQTNKKCDKVHKLLAFNKHVHSYKMFTFTDYVKTRNTICDKRRIDIKIMLFFFKDCEHKLTMKIQYVSPQTTSALRPP